MQTKVNKMWDHLLAVARYERSIRDLSVPVLWDMTYDAIKAALTEEFERGVKAGKNANH